MVRWPHQLRAVAAVHEAISRGERRICLTSPTGGGKTVIATDLIQDWLAAELKVILYSNRRMLIEQTSRVMSEAGLLHGVRAAGHDETADNLQVSSIQTEGARVVRRGMGRLFEAARVLVDECFIGETLIFSTRGLIRIDKVRCGDTVYCASGIGVVENVSCRPTKQLYRVEFDNGSRLFCTGNHPFLTTNGWRDAAALDDTSLTLGVEAVCDMWQTVPSLEKALSGEDGQGDGRKGVDRSAVLLNLLFQEVAEPHEQLRIETEDARDVASNSSSSFEAWRQRAIAALAAIGTTARSWRGLGIGSACADPDAERQRLSDLLQGGCWERVYEIGVRDRRPFARYERQAPTRRQETRPVGSSRLVRLSRIQLEDSVPVFNLRVSGHPSYFANGFLVHNCHLLKSTEAAGILAQHVQQGAAVVGLTATPLDIGHLYDKLIVAGTLTELRACGALVMARHFGCDEPDLKSIKKIPTGDDIPESQLKKVYPCTQALFGRVLGEFRRLNPEGKPSILFACGVDESVWFCGQFNRAGIKAAHIDGNNVLIGDKLYRSSPEARAEVMEGSKNGSLKVLCNRFVLREGIDAPWLTHGIFATVFGSLQSYLQSGGRLLRSNGLLSGVSIQDHGGNWWRHGSLNADRDWNLAFTPGIVSGLREESLRAKKLFEPFLCPECKQVLMSRRCPCGFEIKNFVRSRPVVQSDGTLREMRGEIFKPRRVSKAPNGPKLWERMYYRSKTDKGARTFRAAAALFAQENNWGWPNNSWPLMPIEALDWFRLVADVPMERLTQ